jgi:hypothetical protein
MPQQPFNPAVRMPTRLPTDSWFVVVDNQGQILVSELLPPGTDLPKRLLAAAVHYGAQGWTGSPSPGRWSFIVSKGRESLAIGIRAARPGKPPDASE